jgi:hypothetical protein
MAWNVYLTVFKKKTTRQLKYLEPYYIAGCYGIPLSVAITFLFVKKEGKGRMYGPATLWCWISEDWQVLRIATFYGPVWYLSPFPLSPYIPLISLPPPSPSTSTSSSPTPIRSEAKTHRVVLIITFFIYVCAGRVIFNLRRNFRNFVNANPIAPKPACNIIELSTVTDTESGTVRNSRSTAPDTAYSCTISAQGETSVAAAAAPSTPYTRRKKKNTAMEANTAAWAYCRCAMLFFLALVITWVRVFCLFPLAFSAYPHSLSRELRGSASCMC